MKQIAFFGSNHRNPQNTSKKAPVNQLEAEKNCVNIEFSRSDHLMFKTA